jgi:glycosyltransferase involved in cell wall biosynthesis
MPHSPVISVIMPCYNAGQTVARAIKSIRNQTHQSWELLVIDDGSTDDSAKIAASLAEKDPRIRLVRRSHSGVVKTSNHGFTLAQGKFIARMDADDVSHIHRLERQLNELIPTPSLGTVSCLVHFAGDSIRAGGYAHHVQWANQWTTPEQIALNRFVDLPAPHPTLMFRRNLIETYGGYRDGDFPEDYEMLLRWISNGIQIGKINETLFDWHDPPTRLSRNDSRYDMDAFHACKAPYLKQAIQHSGCGERELWIWGAGRPARKCARPLERLWKQAAGFIDIDPRKIGRTIHGSPVVSPDHLPPAEQAVIVSYVATRGAGELIRRDLIAAGRTEGKDFWIAA